jgi:hypothetical protein
MAFASACVCCLLASQALGQYWVRPAPDYYLSQRPVPYVAAEEPTAPSPSDQVLAPAPPAAPQPASGKDAGTCEASGSCGTFGGLDLCHEGDPWELFPENCRGLKIGGWLQAGYNDKTDGKFNSHPGRVNLHQGYVYMEKVANGDCGWDWGFRTDLVYGVDAQDTQAFGNNPGNWDFRNGFDHGIYGWAIPQAYAEFANCDLSVKVGHFYTPVGYEVVTAPDNFFYSHSYTMYNSEPFTHTGALATYNATDKLTAYAGWTAGWDTGFDMYSGGNNFMGGFGYSLTDNVKMTYHTCFGDLGWRGEGYNHSLVFDVSVTEKLNYVLQSDLVQSDGYWNVDTGVFYPGQRDDVGVNQYLIYQLNDCWAVGGRLEWWKRDGSSLWEATAGVNWKPHPNFVLRPEIRYNWGPGLANYFGSPTDAGSIFGIDGIFTF